MELVCYLRHHIISHIHNKTYKNDASEYYIQKKKCIYKTEIPRKAGMIISKPGFCEKDLKKEEKMQMRKKKEKKKDVK